MTVINKKCLPKNCKTRKTAKDRMVNTLAGSYNTSEMVVMCNLRLPELDKNRNIDQQKALVFESKTCKYDVNLGAVIGHGIGGKYIPIMAHLAEARRWSKRRQTCLSSPDLTAIHNE